MSMPNSILVPLDGSTLSTEALPLARTLARHYGAELHLVHVIPPALQLPLASVESDLGVREQVRAGALRYLEDFQREAEAEGIFASARVLEGRAGTALRDFIDLWGIELVVMTSHGSGGVVRWWLGSVADELLSTAPADVLLVPPWDDTLDRPSGVPRFQKVLISLDGSELSERALPPAIELAELYSAELYAATVVPKPFELTSIYGVSGVELSGPGHEERLEEARAYLRQVAERFGVAIEGRVVESGTPAEGIQSAVRAVGADLVVISSHGRGGLERVVLGSVADKVIRSSLVPVLVVRR